MEAVPQLRIPSSQIFSVFVKLTKARVYIASNGDAMNHDHFSHQNQCGHGNLVRLLKLVNVSHHAQLELSFPLLPEPQMQLDLM